MLFSAKNGGTPSRLSKTPQKNGRVTTTPLGKQSKKQSGKFEAGQKEKGTKESIFKYRTKDSYQILQCLEQIYQELNFN